MNRNPRPRRFLVEAASRALPRPAERLAEPFGIRVLDHYFADDLEPKSPDIFARGVTFARHALAKKENRLYIHCAAGYHRAPLMTLAILCTQGWAIDDAKRHIRKCRPCVGWPDVYVNSVRQFLRESSLDRRGR